MTQMKFNQKSGLIENDIVALIKTTNGTITIKLFQDLVPFTVNNFIIHSQDGYYNDVIFHRVIKGFMIQGGDPDGTGMGGTSIYGEKFIDEFHSDLTNIKYSLSMANAGPDTNGSQFFINQADNNFLDNKHSVFGYVIEGTENVEKIAKTQTGSQDRPKKDIKIISITIQQYKKSKLEDYVCDKKKALSEYNSHGNNLENTKKIEKTSKKTKKLEEGDSVSVHYTLTVDGVKKDSSHDRGQAFEFILGNKQVIPAWDEELVGHKIGETFKLEVQPEKGYGVYDKNKLEVIPREQLQSFEENGIELKKGTILPTQFGEFTIEKADEKEITLNVNHALAGKILHFDIEITDIN